jgi:hypothetical protein
LLFNALVILHNANQNVGLLLVEKGAKALIDTGKLFPADKVRRAFNQCKPKAYTSR